MKGIQIARRIAKKAPLAAHISEEHAPGADVALEDEEAIQRVRKRRGTTPPP